MRWFLEEGVFGSGASLAGAARAAGHGVTTWDDDWWQSGSFPAVGAEPTVFHGSLGNAARVRALGWRPGAFCATEAFLCSRWLEPTRAWALNAAAVVTTAERLVAAPPAYDRMFVRPDSPLKPFSGRVVSRVGLTLEALDFGFYYDDPSLPVVVAPAVAVEEEWRFVVADGRVVAGSGYQADGRRTRPEPADGEAWAFAAGVAGALEPPEAVYVLDVCRSAGALRLVELNPFSGADLYACDPPAVVAAVAAVARRLAPG